MHVAGVNADPATFEHIDPALVGNRRERADLRALGQGHGRRARRGSRHRARRRRRRAGGRARQGARAPRLPLRGRRRLVRAADPRETGEYEPLFRLESWRAIVEKREDGRVQTEATIKIWVDGERYVRTAEGNGPVNALDSALREAIGEIHPHLRDIKLVNFKVRILDESKGTGAVTRVLLDASDGSDTWGAIGVSENVIEASWEALVDSLEAGMQPGRDRHGAAARPRREQPRPRERGRRTSIPLARPVLGRGGGGARCSRCCAPGSCRSARASPRVRAARSPRGSGARTRAPSPAARPGCTWRCAPSASATATRSSRRRSRSSPPPTSSLYERARPVFADIDPVTLNLDPAAAAAAITDRTTALLPVHIFGYPADMPGVRARSGCRSSRTPARRSARSTPTAARSAPAATRRSSASTPTSSSTTGEGGMVTLGRRRDKERIDSERNQGRAPDMGWLDHDRLGFNYRLTDIACALGLAQLERLDEHARRPRPRRRAATARRWPASRGSTLPCEDAGGDRRGWFVFVVQLPPGVDRDDGRPRAARARRRRASPTCPRST